VTLIGERLKLIAQSEQLPFEAAAIALLARAADGSMRDALSLLDQLIAFGGSSVTEANARAMLGTIDRGHVSRLVDALARGDGAALLGEVGALDVSAPDYDRALAELATFIQRIAIVQIVPDAAFDDEEFEAGDLRRLAQAITPEDAQLYYQIALGGRRDLSMAPDPRAGFEMTLLRMLAFRPEDAPQAAMTSASGKQASGKPAASAAPAAKPGNPPQAAPRAAEASVAEPTARLLTIDAGNWPAVVEAAALSGMVRQFAMNCVPSNFANDVLNLKIDPAVAERRTRAIDDKLILGLSKYFGRDLRVNFETAEADIASPARLRAAAEQERIARAASAFESDPTVKGLRERFGADIDSGSVRPVNRLENT
jgi:DNA polymerase-3 subunit gamma/tau